MDFLLIYQLYVEHKLFVHYCHSLATTLLAPCWGMPIIVKWRWIPPGVFTRPKT
jgi:hypothetical protein